ncbi:putative NADPH-cytochrome P450 reductase [Halenospora varia]|nr:putative NADPH-cytochrome P450 reductase [Halenospora varia]
MMDMLSLLELETPFRKPQKDDIAFFLILIFMGLFYNVFIKEKSDPYHQLWYEKPQDIDGNVKKSDTRDIGLKAEENGKDLVVFWGSQSGTAEGYANQLVRECRSRFGIDGLTADFSDYDPESIARISETKLAVFIMSTYGEGDPSDNASHFISWLKSNTIGFPQLRYVAFGLGNKNYKFYNHVIDVVVEELDQLGARALMAPGKGDDSNGTTDEDFVEWKQVLFSVLHERLGIEERLEQYEPSIRVVEDCSLDIIDLHIGEPLRAPGRSKTPAISHVQPLPIRVARKLLTTSDQNCLHLELDIGDFPELKYKTGDHLAIWPSNPNSEVQRLVNILGVNTEIPLLISSLDPACQVKVPSPTTWRALFHYYIDICAPVSREIVLALAQFAPSATAKETLKQLGEDRDTYRDYCSKNHVTVGRLLEAVSSSPGSWSGIPLPFILETLPLQSPRYYSISSSSIVSPKKISITVATSSEVSPANCIPIPGLTTNYLLAIEYNKRVGPFADGHAYDLAGPNDTLDQGYKVFAHIRKSRFRLPTLARTPIIMISSGSGIAPFRGFLAERARLASIGREVGPSLLFFGCRSPEHFLYRDELRSLQESHQEMHITTAFSRVETNRWGEKRYVQDTVEEQDERLVKLLLEHNAYLYICGNASMARDVGSRLGGCLKKRLGWSEAELRKWSELMRKTQRWQEDVWG